MSVSPEFNHERHPMKCDLTFLFGKASTRIGTRAGRPRLKAAHRLQAEVENLEGRALLATTVAEFSLPSGAAATSRLTTDYSSNLWLSLTRSSDGVVKDSIARVASDGTISEFPLPDGHLTSRQTGLSLDFEGNLWFLEKGRVGRVTPDGVISEFAVPPSEATTTTFVAPTIGPDGSFWFVEARLFGADHGASIDRVTADGKVSRFPAVLDAGLTSVLTLGPDGNLYFTGGQLAKINPEGVVTRLTLPDDGQPFSPTIDNEGNLVVPYNTLTRGTGLARVDAEGNVKDTPLTGVKSVTLGGDGELWFSRSTSAGRTGFGHLAPDGTVTELKTTVPGSIVSAGVLSFDGNIWFAEQSLAGQGPALVRVAPDGTVTEFPVTQAVGNNSVAGPDLEGLTNGPDGNLWYVNNVTGSVGRANLDLPPIETVFPGVPPIAWAAGGSGNFVTPELKSVTRSGTLRQPTKLTLAFNTALDASSASNLTNYSLVRVGPRGHARSNAKPIAIKAAVYDSATNTVTLTPTRRLRLNGYFRLTVNGAKSGGVSALGGATMSRSERLIHRFGTTTPKNPVANTKVHATTHVPAGPHRLASAFRLAGR